MVNLAVLIAETGEKICSDRGISRPFQIVVGSSSKGDSIATKLGCNKVNFILNQSVHNLS